MKVVINTCFGGFNLSTKALLRYRELSGSVGVYACEIDRADPALIQVVEELGTEAGGDFSRLKIVEIPDDVLWQIEEYDGIEHVAEVHRTWS